MPDKKSKPHDTELKAFIKSGGRTGAEADFNQLLKQATKPKKDNKPSSLLYDKTYFLLYTSGMRGYHRNAVV